MKWILAPVLLALILGVIAGASVLFGEAWLAPSLGSAAFSQMLHSEQPSSKPYSIAVGQILGALAGFAGVAIAGLVHVGPFMGDHGLYAGRILAVVIAVVLVSGAQIVTGAKTPAGGATALIVALGLETTTWMGALRLLVGIVAVTALGEAARRTILRASPKP